jgi:[acyl-carrier-protein] S-malonyltransferase
MTVFFVFPGQGSQYPGMGKSWCEEFAAARLAFEEASDFTGLNLKRLCFEGSEDDLKQTEITQPALLTTTVAIARVLQSDFGMKELESQAIYAGHSLGEYSALTVMGAVGLGPAARLVRARGKFMQEAVPAGVGGMAALLFRPKTDATGTVASLCERVSAETKQFVAVANYNSPEQIVISGHAEAVKSASETALLEPWSARKAVPLAVSAPFHCGLMEPAALRLRDELAGIEWQRVDRRYVANVDAALYDLSKAADLAGLAPRLERQVTGSVLWTQSVRAAAQAGATRFVEIGPSKVLSGLLGRISVGEKPLEGTNIDRWEDFKNGARSI